MEFLLVGLILIILILLYKKSSNKKPNYESSNYEYFREFIANNHISPDEEKVFESGDFFIIDRANQVFWIYVKKIHSGYKFLFNDLATCELLIDDSIQFQTSYDQRHNGNSLSDSGLRFATRGRVYSMEMIITTKSSSSPLVRVTVYSSTEGIEYEGPEYKEVYSMAYTWCKKVESLFQSKNLLKEPASTYKEGIKLEKD